MALYCALFFIPLVEPKYAVSLAALDAGVTPVTGLEELLKYPFVSIDFTPSGTTIDNVFKTIVSSAGVIGIGLLVNVLSYRSIISFPFASSFTPFKSS